jgi:DNA-binding NarL/FixJ family response regulator
MPKCNGLEALEKLRALAPDGRVLVLTMHDDVGYLRQVLASGGAGYVLKQAASDELLTAIRTVHNGGVFLHSSHAKNLLEQSVDETVPPSASADPLACLSERELEVVRQVALGHSNKEIGGMLHLSVKTVETYKARAMEKLNLGSRAGLVRFALQQGLLDEAKT